MGWATVRAQGDEPVHVGLSACPEQTQVDLAEALEIARSELAPRDLEITWYQPANEPLQIWRVVVCETARFIAPGMRSDTPAREVPLSKQPAETRARMLALVLSELASEPASATAEAGSPPRAPPAQPTKLQEPLPRPTIEPRAPTKPARRRRERPGTTGFEAGSELRLIGPPRTLLWGPRITLLIPHVQLAALALLTQRETDLGDIRLGEALAEVGYEPYAPHPSVALALKLAAGATWTSGRPAPDASTVSAVRFAGAALAGVRARMPFARSGWFGTLFLLGGYNVGLRARAAGTVMATTHGACLSAALALGFR